MNLITVEVDDAKLVIAPGIGGSIAGWTWRGEPMMRPTVPDTLSGQEARDLSSYPLFPYSNRVAGRCFRFEGVSYDLPDLMNGQAIHGAGWRLPWAAMQDGPTATIMLEHAPDALWPFAFMAEQRFTLAADSLTCDLRIENREDRPTPAGFGLHPYFPRSPAMRLRFAAEHVWLNGETDMIPVQRVAVPPAWDHRHGLPVGDIALDNCFAGWDGRVRLDYPDRGFAIEMTADPIFRHLVVYIPPDRPFLAVEPVSNMNDGLNRMHDATDHGVFVLQPGESRSGRIRYAVEHLDADGAAYTRLTR